MMTLADLLKSGKSEDEINSILSGSTIGTGGMNPNFMGQPYAPPQMPENYIRNERTGRVIDLMPARQSPALDYSSAPVEFGGMKGYRVKGDPFSVVMADGRILRLGEDSSAAYKREEMRLDLEKKRQEAAGAGRPYYQFLPTEKGIAVGDTRSGTLKLGTLGGDGMPVMRASDSPQLQGEIAGAKQQAEADVKTKSDAGKAINTGNQFLSAAQTAKTLLEANVTQSGVGAFADKAAALVGYSPESSQNAAKLEALSGWMVSNVPRMEGPQSNYDVENYKVMAGKVGDRTVPVEERKAALATVIGLQEKYRHLNQDRMQGAQRGATVPVKSESEAMKLPPGTRFQLPDGRTGTAK